MKNLHSPACQIGRILNKKAAFQGFLTAKKLLLRGISVAKYIVGQERRLVDPPSQVVAGVRTVTTNMNGRDTLPRCRAHSLFSWLISSEFDLPLVFIWPNLVLQSLSVPARVSLLMYRLYDLNESETVPHRV